MSVGCITMIRGLKFKPHIESSAPKLFAYPDLSAER